MPGLASLQGGGRVILIENARVRSNRPDSPRKPTRPILDEEGVTSQVELVLQIRILRNGRARTIDLVKQRRVLQAGHTPQSLDVRPSIDSFDQSIEQRVIDAVFANSEVYQRRAVAGHR